MKLKFILEIYDNEGKLLSSEKVPSYRAIEKKTGIQYHNCRSINHICTGKLKKKFTHSTLDSLLKRVKIFDNEDNNLDSLLKCNEDNNLINI